jgi:hypothetical protein
MEIHAWKAEFEQNQRRNHDELLKLLSQVKYSQDSMERVISANSKQISWIMGFIQQVCQGN